MVGPVAGLVAERPHDDARMVPIALDHPRPAGHPCRSVPGVVAQAGVVGVALDVRLVDHVHAELVAQVEQPRVVGVVRAPHGGDVVAPHGEQVVAHVGDRHRLAAVGVVVVAVHAVDPDPLTVDEQVAVADLDAAEPDELGVNLDQRAVGVEQLGDRRGTGTAARPTTDRRRRARIGSTRRARGTRRARRNDAAPIVVTDGASRRPPSVSTVVRTAQPDAGGFAPPTVAETSTVPTPSGDAEPGVADQRR